MSEWGLQEWVFAVGWGIVLVFSGVAIYAAYWISKVQAEAEEEAKKAEREREKQERISKGGYDKVTFIEAAGESEDGYRW